MATVRVWGKMAPASAPMTAIQANIATSTAAALMSKLKVLNAGTEMSAVEEQLASSIMLKVSPAPAPRIFLYP